MHGNLLSPIVPMQGATVQISGIHQHTGPDRPHWRSITITRPPVAIARRTLPGILDTDPRRRAAVDAWDALANVLNDRDFELDCEAFSGIWQVYQNARRAGVPVCPVLGALIGCLMRQVLLRNADDEGGR